LIKTILFVKLGLATIEECEKIMSVPKKIQALLKDSGVEYTVIRHDPVYTSEDAAKIRDTNISMGAKALVLFADKKPILAVVPGDRKLDFRLFKNKFDVRDLRMASSDEVREITTLEVGSIPPLGSVMGLKSYYDESFIDKDRVAFNAGSHTLSIKMKASDLLRVENPVISSIT
jgi:Ala-tRNA(Pro) deacylase